jgi:hypothetical protein
LFVFVFFFSYRAYVKPLPAGHEPDEGDHDDPTKKAPTMAKESKSKRFLSSTKRTLAHFGQKLKEIAKNYKFLFLIVSAISEGAIMKGKKVCPTNASQPLYERA